MESLLGGAVFRHRSGRVVALGSTAVLAAAGAGPLIMLTSSTASANAALVVSTLADSGAGSLRQAMLDANSAAGVDTITFTSGLTGTIDVLSDLPALDEGIDLQGPGASVITIDGGWTAAGGDATGHSLFVFDGIYVAEGASTISGVTITGGNSSNNPDNSGGAIEKYYGDADLTIADVVLTGNFADNDGGAVNLRDTDGTVTIRDSVISNNVADGDGGALSANGDDALVLTLNNVEITGNTAKDDGGGIYFYNGTLTIVDSTISGNTADDDDGGGIFFYNGSLTIVDSTISGNTAGHDGGGIKFEDGTLTISDTTISGNTALYDGGGMSFYDGTLTIVESTISGNTAGDDGGGMNFYDGTLTIVESTISGNTADDKGGGIRIQYGSLTIVESTISGNTADDEGGGLYFEDGTLTIVESTISGNTAGNGGSGGLGNGGGGGLWLDDVDGTISDTTISGNTADDGGGGIYLYETLMTISNSTLSGNSADRGGALYIKTDDLDDYGSATFIENSTISGNHAAQDGGAIFTGMDEEIVSLEIVQSTITDNSTDGLGENVGGIALQDNAEVTITGSIVAGNLGNDIGLYTTSLPSLNASDSVLGVIQSGVTLIDGGGTQIGVTDPMLGLLANNGGVTKTHALLVGSPAIDAGPDPVPVFDGNDFDQRGIGFARIVFGVADVGAFEVQEPEPTTEPTTEPIAPTFTG
jgi:parallel beta-helix repeat protein